VLTLRQRIATLVAMLVAALAIALVVHFGQQSILPSRVGFKIPFDGQAAVDYTRILAEDYPDRVTGSPGARRAADYLRSEFTRLGYHVTDDRFTMWLAGREVQGDNVIAEVPGQEPESVAVLAHYDSQTTAHQAAEDNASGVGVLLELARELRPSMASSGAVIDGFGGYRRGLLLVATDAEEWGMIGARHLAGYLKSHHTVAAISIDYLNQGRAPALGIDCMGQGSGYTPLWLREAVIAAGRTQGVTVVGPTRSWEFIERAIEVSAQDQGPLVRAGIPAVNISTLTKEYAASRARYHTTEDVFQNFDPESFRMLGATVVATQEYYLDSVATSDTRLPIQRTSHTLTDRLVDWLFDWWSGCVTQAQRLANSAGPVGMDYWQISPTAYLPGGIVRLIFILGIAPVLLGGVFAGVNFALGRVLPAHGPPGPRPRPSRWVLVRPLVYLIPGLLALIALYALTAANILPRYELYPATPKDPFLYRLPPGVVVTLAIALAAGYAILRFVRARIPRPPSFATTKQVLYLWLCVVVIAAFVLNPFAMALYLALFAYGARWLHPPRNRRSRIINAVTLTLGALPFVALLYSFGKEIFLGPRILWYMVLQTAYGVWSPWAAITFLMAAALWIQFLRACVLAKFTMPTASRQVHP
jgi:peptidase M28-like protein